MATNLKQRFITVEEYHQMIEAGILGPEDRVELIRGQLVEMSPMSNEHSACIDKINKTLNQYLASNDLAIIRVQSSIQASANSQPEPDITVLKNRSDFYVHTTPTGEDIFLVIEIAKTSFARDKALKGPLYAETQIPEYWIVDLDRRCIEAYREPVNGQYTKMDLFLPDTEAYLYGFELRIPVERLIP